MSKKQLSKLATWILAPAFFSLIGWIQTAVAEQKEVTLLDAIKARTDLTVLMEELKELPPDVRQTMRKVIAKAEAQQMGANILLNKDKYADAVKAYDEAASSCRQAINARKVLERLDEARWKAERARVLAEATMDATKTKDARRLMINAEGFEEASEFERGIAELDKARRAYEHLLAAGHETTLEEAVTARTTMLAARKQLRDLPKLDREEKAKIARMLHDAWRSKPTTLPYSGTRQSKVRELLRQGLVMETGATEALEAREYAPAKAFFLLAVSLYNQAGAAMVRLETVAASGKFAEDALKLADAAFENERRPASLERARKSLARAKESLAQEELDEAKQLFAETIELVAKVPSEAALGVEQEAWTKAMVASDESLLAKYASAEYAQAKEKAARSEEKAKAGQLQEATTILREGTEVLKAACAKSLAADRTAKMKGAKTIQVDLGGGEKIRLMLIPAGEFMMGSEDEKPIHTVRIKRPFYLANCEVTQAQWSAVMGDNPSCFKGSGDLPVENISWEDCQEFCKRVSRRGNLEIRLPTEAEWEYACRAGSTGNYCSDTASEKLGQYAWFDENSAKETHAVGGKKPNALGLHDMHGNVWEWCSDWYGPYQFEGLTDPTGPSQGTQRVVRGGSYAVPLWCCRSAWRKGLRPDVRNGSVGFRVAAGG